MNQDIIKEILSNEEYVKSLVALGNVDDAVKQLNADGYGVTAEEVEQFLAQVRAFSDGRLTDDDLENVAGGSGFVMGLVSLFCSSTD